MKKKIFSFVANKFAQAEYKVKYDLSYDECLRRQFIYFGGWGKERYISGRANAYKGQETAESLGVDSIFKNEDPFLKSFVEEAGVSISAHDTIAEIVDRIYASRREEALATVADKIRLWGLKMSELYEQPAVSAVSIH